MANFTLQVSEWVKETKEAYVAVFRESAQRVIEEMQKTTVEGGNMPVDTGFLRASLQVSNTAMPLILNDAAPSAGQKYSYDSGPIALTISNTPLGGTVYAGFSASYAIHVNFGTSKTPARLFVDLAAQKWPQIVKQVEADLTARVQSAS